MYIPEWEIEETLAVNPKLIEIPEIVRDLKLVERQKYLRKLGRYIDLLFQHQEKYVVVEIKSNYIDNDAVVTNQILEYKRGLSKELNIDEKNIICILVSPEGFSDKIIKMCKSYGIIAFQIDENKIINFMPKDDKYIFSIGSDYRKRIFRKILMKRGIFINKEMDANINIINNEIRSIRTWIKYNLHDDYAKSKIAIIFKSISRKAPICAHEVNTTSDGKLISNLDKWFWLFYSVMDRRSNAANFIKARRILEDHNLFRPEEIVSLVNKVSKDEAIAKIAKILGKNGFPLLYDNHLGKLSQPRSIVDAAIYISKYNYDFDYLYDYHYEKNEADYTSTYQSLRKDIYKNIYGAGQRIVSQFIRGMVLKGDWNLPLNDDALLEKCSFNVRFASKLRLGLISSEENYYKELGEFADKYLDGNRAIISHVLWYVRKRYCDKKILCEECKFSGYCRHYLKTLMEPANNKNMKLEDFI